jgi:hypothetical protein
MFMLPAVLRDAEGFPERLFEKSLWLHEKASM